MIDMLDATTANMMHSLIHTQSTLRVGLAIHTRHHSCHSKPHHAMIHMTMNAITADRASLLLHAQSHMPKLSSLAARQRCSHCDLQGKMPQDKMARPLSPPCSWVVRRSNAT